MSRNPQYDTWNAKRATQIGSPAVSITQAIVLSTVPVETIGGSVIFTMQKGNCFNSPLVVWAENKRKIRVVSGNIYQK
ncbi:hypothetical protein JP09_001400 [Dehalogenimonas etheniformans]|uniref:Uncharacterized protein n=1 Tax=Dehalogenimonas etheniformans TaxID=1536648 RepID=A0A2P5P8E9_9CHLR|nr:hypothetical protein JP09_001400 [Dehalogenimonas etheniformans]